MNVEKTSRSSVDDEDDEDDVEGQYNSEWKAEQAARLLPFDDIQDSLADKIYVPTDYGSPTARHGVLKTIVRNSAAVAIGIVLCIIFLIASGRISGFQITQEQTTTQQTGFRRSPSDYVLSPDWDFSENPTTRRYQWTISDEEVNPDGVYRQMILINGQFPGPLIECNEGDTLEIEIDNQSINATSFHWHGIYQNGTNWMDGTVGVTQCPIAPGGKFTYKFTIQAQSGTYWYHSHHVLQAADGLVGPFIVHSAKEKEYQQLEYSTDQVILIQDYYHDPSYSLLPAYLSNGRENSEPIPAGSLINGQNIRNCDALPHRKCDNSTATIPTFDLAPNQNHRLRIINTGVLAEFQIELDEHSFAVTEVDGTDVLPSYIHRLIINPAQRYSLVVATNVTTGDSFWLRTRMATDCWDKSFPNPDLIAGTDAIIRYRDESETRKENAISPWGFPSSQPWGEAILQFCKDLNTTELVPVPAIAASEQVDHSFYLYSNFRIGAWRLSRGFFNDSSWRPNIHSPMLDRFIDGRKSGNESFMAEEAGVNHKAFNTGTEMAIQVEGIKTIDLVIQNINEGNHPMHLHGYKYFVMAQGHGWFDKTKYLKQHKLNTANPLRRDTASVEGFGWMWIRFVTDNPGAWAFHCHVSWHAEAGLQMQFITRPEVVGTWELPQANRDLCLAEGLEKGARIDDSVYFGNFG